MALAGFAGVKLAEGLIRRTDAEGPDKPRLRGHEDNDGLGAVCAAASAVGGVALLAFGVARGNASTLKTVGMIAGGAAAAALGAATLASQLHILRTS